MEEQKGEYSYETHYSRTRVSSRNYLRDWIRRCIRPQQHRLLAVDHSSRNSRWRGMVRTLTTE